MSATPDRPDAAPAGHVIIVDDEASVLVVLAKMVRRGGHAVETYGSPAAFLENAKLDPPCCLVLDLNMPGMSGIELQDRLGRLPQPPEIVFVSGSASVPSSVKAMKAGAVDFLAKPFEPKDLLAAVDVALDRARRRMADQAGATGARQLLARLTPRERQVCLLVAQGLRSREIARELGAAVKTVNIHRSRVMAKLGAATVVDLVNLVRRAEPR